MVITDGTADFTNIPYLNQYVDLFVSPQTLNVSKVNGEAYTAVMKAFPSIPASSCVMIGDNPVSDIAKAKEKGWKTIYIAPSSEANAADWTVPSVSKLLSWFVCSVNTVIYKERERNKTLIILLDQSIHICEICINNTLFNHFHCNEGLTSVLLFYRICNVGFSRAAATRSLSLICRFSDSSVLCVPGDT